MKYKNYIFDFGNVLYLFNAKEILSKYTDSKEEMKLLNDIIFENWKDLDIGNISYDKYIENAIEKAPDSLKKTIELVLKTWHKALPQVDGMIDVLKIVKEKAEGGVYLLSNAPEILDDVKEVYPEVEFFDDIIISGQVKMVKPDEKIYLYALERFGIKPEETLFIDDKMKNIEGAKKVGLNTYNFDGNIENLKKEIGI